jgi:hypothetical protein
LNLGRNSSFSSFFSGELLSYQARETKKHHFKPFSYALEKRTGNTPDIIHHYNRIARLQKVAIADQCEEKGRVNAAVQREMMHIETVRQEKQEREAIIRETLQILATGKDDTGGGHPPSLSQLRQISSAILNEGLRFKKRSEIAHRIDAELGAGFADDSGANLLDLASNKTEVDVGTGMPNECVALSRLIYKRTDYKLRLEMVLANGDMLNRMIYDCETALETAKAKKATLQSENLKLECEFEELLESLARAWGELSWKCEVLKKTGKIAAMGKNT